jgi:hypothetical protein
MARSLRSFADYQVFLNHPYDDAYASFEDALAFAVVASNLLPISSRDFTTPDVLRLAFLADAIENCAYSVHDLSRATGEGDTNFARMNMPIEGGMALYRALSSQHRSHRCGFFFSTPNAYKAFASDLSGLDPKVYDEDPRKLAVEVYTWLQDVVSPPVSAGANPSLVGDAYDELAAAVRLLAGEPSPQIRQREAREITYRVCAARQWWEWRDKTFSRGHFPAVPLRWAGDAGALGLAVDTRV